MRFMVIVKATEQSEAGVLPGEELLLAMGRYNEELIKAGIMVSGDGLKASSHGARVTFKGDQRIVTDGPFAEVKELVAGYWIWQLPSLAEAIEWVKRCPNPMAGESDIEIRPLFELEDFAPGEGVELHERLREENSRKPVPQQINPYLLFNGNCEEAFNFYAETLGGVIEAMMPHAGTEAANHVPAEWHAKILHARLRVGNQVLMASDAPPGQYQAPQGFSVSLQIDDPAEAERAFFALAEGGTVQMPFGETFWAHRFGMAVDRFGTPWMINCEKAPAA